MTETTRQLSSAERARRLRYLPRARHDDVRVVVGRDELVGAHVLDVADERLAQVRGELGLERDARMVRSEEDLTHGRP